MGVEILIPAPPWFIQKLVTILCQPWPLPALLSWARSLVTEHRGGEVSTCRKWLGSGFLGPEQWFRAPALPFLLPPWLNGGNGIGFVLLFMGFMQGDSPKVDSPVSSMEYTLWLPSCCFFFIHLFYFIYFWLCWVFIAVCGLSLVVVNGGYSSMQCTGFSLWWLLLLRSTGCRYAGFSSCGSRVLECSLSSCGAWA